MTTIDVNKLIDPKGPVVASSLRVGDAVVRALGQDELVELNLRGVRGLSSSFFNVLLQRVVAATTRDDFERRVKISFESAAQAQIFRRSFDSLSVPESRTPTPIPNGKIPFGTLVRVYAGWPQGHNRADQMLSFLARHGGGAPAGRWQLSSSDVGPGFVDIDLDPAISVVLQLKRRIRVERRGAVIVGSSVSFRPRADVAPYADRDGPLPESIALGSQEFRIRSIHEGDHVIVFTRVYDRDDGRIAFANPQDLVLDDYAVVAYGGNRWDALQRLREGLETLGPV